MDRTFLLLTFLALWRLLIALLPIWLVARRMAGMERG